MKRIEYYFTVVLCVMLYTVVLIVKSVDEILQCDYEQFFSVVPFVVLSVSVSWVDVGARRSKVLAGNITYNRNLFYRLATVTSL